ncbi:MAG: T9SS type A sorting domain-containing protein [Bacteroidota bacterium]
MRFFTTLFLISFPLFFISAQPPASAQMDVGRLRISISQDGNLGSDDVPFLSYRLEDGTFVSLLQKGGLQFGGLDPTGNVVVANFDGTTNRPGLADFQGFLPGVFRVTKNQVETHIADFADNLMIDDTISAIFGWPGLGNSLFETYAEISLPLTYQNLADFWDANTDGVYNPDVGDTPHFFTRPFVEVCAPEKVPTEMFWVAFSQRSTDLSPVTFQINHFLTIASFGCPDADPGSLENRSFVIHYKTIYQEEESTIDTHFGLNMLSALGDPGNDALGTDPESNLAYFYSTTETDDAFGEEAVPMVGIFPLKGPLYPDASPTSLQNILPIYKYENGPVAFGPAADAAQFYNTLQGHWRDGSSLTFGGNGFESGEPTNFAFPGTPGNPEEWTFAAVDELPNGVGASINYEAIELLPGAVNEHTFVVVVTSEGTTAAERLASLRGDFEQLAPHITGTPFCSIYTDCSTLPSSIVTTEASFLSFRVYPNPINNDGQLLLDFGQDKSPDLQQLLVVDMLGRQLAVDWSNGKGVDVGQLPVGAYTILAQTVNGDWYRSRFVKR